MFNFITEYASGFTILFGALFFICGLILIYRKNNKAWHYTAFGTALIIVGMLLWFPTAHH